MYKRQILLLFKKQYDSKEIYYVPEYTKRPGDAFKFCQHLSLIHILYLIAAKPFNSVTVPSSFGRLMLSNEIGRYAMATESKSAIASKIRVRRDFKIRFKMCIRDSFKTYCFRWPRRWRLVFSFYDLSGGSSSRNLN